MYKSLGILVLAALVSCYLLAAVSLANPPPGNNKLGIYSTDDGQGFAHIGKPHAPVTGVHSAYLITTGLTDPSGIHGWECCVEVPPEIFYIGETIIGPGAINIDTPPCFAVGIPDPLPRNAWGGVVLAELRFLLVDFNDHELFLHPGTIPSIPDSMVYALGRDPEILRGFLWSSNAETKPVFGFNTGPLNIPIATEAASWGEIKSMYR